MTPEKDKWIAEKVAAFQRQHSGCVVEECCYQVDRLRATLNEAWEKGYADSAMTAGLFLSAHKPFQTPPEA